jgi:hypothetical protein
MKMDTKPSAFEIPKCLQGIAAVEADLEHLTAKLTECQFQAPPRSGGWSIGYCIEHLTLTGNRFLAEWSTALHRAPSNGHHSHEPVAYSWMQRRILEFAEPPYRIKIKTTSPFIPCSRRSMEETVRRFLKMHYEFAGIVPSSQGRDTSRIKVQSPFLSSIRYSLGMSFDLALAHERRHLWQAWQVRTQLTGEAD